MSNYWGNPQNRQTIDEFKSNQNYLNNLGGIVKTRTQNLSEGGIYRMKDQAYSLLKCKMSMDAVDADDLDIGQPAIQLNVFSSAKLPELQKNGENLRLLKTIGKLKQFCNTQRQQSIAKHDISYHIAEDHVSAEPSIGKHVNLSTSMLPKMDNPSQKKKTTFREVKSNKTNESIPEMVYLKEDGPTIFNHSSLDKDANNGGSTTIGTYQVNNSGFNDSMPIKSRARLKSGSRKSKILRTSSSKKSIGSKIDYIQEDEYPRLSYNPITGPIATYIRNPGLYFPPDYKPSPIFSHPRAKLAVRLPRHLRVTQSTFNDFYTINPVKLQRIFKIVGLCVSAMVKWRRCARRTRDAIEARWLSEAREKVEMEVREREEMQRRERRDREEMEEREKRNERIRIKKVNQSADSSFIGVVSKKGSILEIEKSDLAAEIRELLKKSSKNEISALKLTVLEKEYTVPIKVREPSIQFQETLLGDRISPQELDSAVKSLEIGRMHSPGSKLMESPASRIMDSSMYARFYKGSSTLKEFDVSILDSSINGDTHSRLGFEVNFLNLKPAMKTIDFKDEYKLSKVDLEARYQLAKERNDYDLSYTSHWMEIIDDLLGKPSLTMVDEIGYYSFLGLHLDTSNKDDQPDGLDIRKIKDRRAFMSLYSKVILDIDLDEEVIEGLHDKNHHEKSYSGEGEKVGEKSEPYYVQPASVNKQFYKNLYAPNYKIQRTILLAVRSSSKILQDD